MSALQTIVSEAQFQGCDLPVKAWLACILVDEGISAPADVGVTLWSFACFPKPNGITTQSVATATELHTNAGKRPCTHTQLRLCVSLICASYAIAPGWLCPGVAAALLEAVSCKPEGSLAVARQPIVNSNRKLLFYPSETLVSSIGKVTVIIQG